jgi:hypothetical protein
VNYVEVTHGGGAIEDDAVRGLADIWWSLDNVGVGVDVVRRSSMVVGLTFDVLVIKDN